jgi:hypothetical protein
MVMALFRKTRMGEGAEARSFIGVSLTQGYFKINGSLSMLIWSELLPIPAP